MSEVLLKHFRLLVELLLSYETSFRKSSYHSGLADLKIVAKIV